MRAIMFLGSVRDGRMCSRVAKLVESQLKAANFEVEVFDPLVMEFPLLKTPVHFSRDPSQIPQWMHDADQKIKNADAIVVVSGEYNYTIPPALTNMMDHFAPASYAGKPAGIVSYSMGSAGGIRAATHLRDFLPAISMAAIPHSLAIAEVHNVISEDGTIKKETAPATLPKSAEKLGRDLYWYASALKNHRMANGGP